MDNNRRVKAGCYVSNMSMSVTSTLSPLLFLSFREMYGISYSLLGALILVNFFTQLTVDLLFSFFSHKFNIPFTIRLMPALTVVGFTLYALAPVLFSGNVYLGLLLGTIIFSASSGLGEVLLSPVVAALPSDNPEREMSKLHSSYAWGVVGVAILSTLFLFVFGKANWPFMMLFYILVPFLAFLLLLTSDIPPMQTPERVSGVLSFFKNPWLWICVAGIFLGGASEVCMAQWCSSYLEQSFSIPKVWGDVFGVALFSLMLGLGRTLYGKYGKNVTLFLFLGACGAFVCYMLTALSPFPLVGLLACAFTGFCVSMLWPGTLIHAADRFPAGGVFIYALMAAGGDSGVAISSQIIGIVTDSVLLSENFESLAQRLSMTMDQLAMRAGMLTGALFPLLAVVVFGVIHLSRKK